jgi:hypothetical protein
MRAKKRKPVLKLSSEEQNPANSEEKSWALTYTIVNNYVLFMISLKYLKTFI